MAKKWYFGVNNVAEKVSKLYFGVAGVARKVSKIYIGENGVAKLCYESKKADEEVIFTTSASGDNAWTVPADAKTIDIFCVGGGGGAGGSIKIIAGQMDFGSNYRTTYVFGACGGSGYTATVKNISVTAGERLNIAVGSGGTGGKSYCNLEGTDFSDSGVTAYNRITDGGDGNQSYVSRGGTILCSAAGGKGGKKANYTSPSAGYYNGTQGADGGNASGAGGSSMNNLYIQPRGSSEADTDIYYIYQMHGLPSAVTQDILEYLHGAHSIQGEHAGTVDKWFKNASIGSESEHAIAYNSFNGGEGQGYNTRKYQDPNETLYAVVGKSPSANTGDSGGQHEVQRYVSQNYRPMVLAPYTDKAGSSGIVIIKVHY